MRILLQLSSMVCMWCMGYFPHLFSTKPLYCATNLPPSHSFALITIQFNTPHTHLSDVQQQKQHRVCIAIVFSFKTSTRIVFALSVFHFWFSERVNASPRWMQEQAGTPLPWNRGMCECVSGRVKVLWQRIHRLLLYLAYGLEIIMVLHWT